MSHVNEIKSFDSDSAPSVSMAILTCNRPTELRVLLDRVQAQTMNILRICLVDTGLGEAPADKGNLVYIKSAVNLGGAGGFSFALLAALASGAEWIWMMDDDAYPIEPDCLQRLLNAAEKFGLDVVCPLVVAPENQLLTSFPFKVGGKLTYESSIVQKHEFLPNIGHFFNGALIRRDVLFKIGLPDIRLFIRGDEVDFMLRLRKSKMKFGILTSARVAHPTGWAEAHDVIKNRLSLLIPETSFKRYYFFRNRGVLARRHFRFLSFFADIVLYPYVFVVLRKGDWRGLRLWGSAFWDGLRFRFSSNGT